MRLKELASIVSGSVVGNGDQVIKAVAPIEEAQSGDLVFVLSRKFLQPALRSRASAVVAPSSLKISGKPAILVKDPRFALAKILPHFVPRKEKAKGVHATAVVPASCRIGKDVYLGAFVVLDENVSIGDGSRVFPHAYIGRDTRIGRECVIHSNVSIYEDVIIGDRVTLHAGARIGVDGFGYVQEAKRHIKIPQVGKVIIEDDAEIYANVCISRATLGATIIGAGTKIDNLTHVAHNCKLGKNCAVVSLVGFAGSVTLKDNVYVAGQVGMSGHISVGENSVIMARAGITKDIPSNSTVSGFPAQDHHREMEFQAALRRLAQKAK